MNASFTTGKHVRKCPFKVTDSATFTTPEVGDEDTGEDLGGLLLEVLPSDGSTMGVGRENR